jgi:hypothetical protein
MTNNPVIPDTTASVDFLSGMFPGEPCHLVGMLEGKGPEAKTFSPSETALMAAWIDSRQGLQNIYYHVNRLADGFRDAKAKKSDVVAGLFLHVDVDDPEALDRIKNYLPCPTALIFSGGGYQALWRLRGPCFDLKLVEQCNRRIAKDLGGDNCHNIDRILRLPGTINVPNAKKRRAGRTEALAYVV